MANEIKLKIKVDDDGSLSIVGKEAKAAADELDNVSKAGNKMGKSSKDADRNLKGLSRQSANTTKNFSKMQQGMTGGLVPAYAILASNVFALSAAFEFFKRAADLSNLEASQISYAENTGVALGSITQRLREASGGMLGFRESAQAAAIGMAKGFSPAQLEDLAEGARKASVALGRNFEDSFDRLIRGASKAEPELLDELGITLRLEDATKKYAASIGKSAKELNTYQRSQAVLIETQRQLEKNFGGMDAAVNPFIKLQKTFDDIIKSGTEFFLPLFQGIANILSSSATSAIAAFGLLGASIFKTIFPMEELDQKLTDFADSAVTEFKEAKQAASDYADEVKQAGADIEATRAGGASDMQATAQRAIDQGADSPVLQRAAAGTMTPQDKANFQKALDSQTKQIETQGKVTRGMFKNVSNDLVTDMSGAFKRMEAPSIGFFKRQGKRIVLFGKRAKLVFKGFAAAGKAAFYGVAKAAQFAGRIMDKALKFAGIIGIIKLVFDAVMGLAQAPMTVALGFARMADRIVNFTGPLIDYVAEGFLGMGDSVKNTWNNISAGVQNMINEIKAKFKSGILNSINDAKEAANKLIATFNTVTGSNLSEFTITPAPDPDDYEKVTAEVSNMAGSYQKVNTEGNRFETMLRESSIGKYAQSVEDAADRVKASAAALKEFRESAKAAEKSLGGVVTGMDKAVADGINPSTVAFNGLISLDIAGLFERIGATTRKWQKDSNGVYKWVETSTMTVEDQNSAIAELEQRMGGLVRLSPSYASALEKALAGDDSDLKALAKDITNTNVQLAFFNEGLESTKTSVKDALSGSDMRSAISGLEQLRDAGNDAGEGIERSTGQTGKLSELQQRFKELFGEGTDANELLSTLKEIQAETDSIALAQSLANGMSSENKTIMEEVLAVRTADNEIRKVSLQLANAQNEVERKTFQQALDLLNVEKAIAEQRTARRRSASMKTASGGFGNTAAGLANQTFDIGLINTQQSAAQAEMDQLKALGQTGTPEEIQARTQRIAELKDKLVELQQQLDAMKEGQAEGIFKNLAADFAALGPEGELMSSVSMGMANIITSVEAFGDAAKGSAERMAAGFQMAGAVVSSISNIMNAAHKNRMRGIDAEIKAEKNRDGKSKESLARIKSLEKKKEDMARKNFEMNKKMQMAQVVISTAAAIAQVWANPADVFKVWAPVMTGVIAAMGAAQLAMIAGTSFQGGGSGSGMGAGVSSVTLGERRNTVDLGRSRGARGELAYMRGDQGVGGPEDFRSAFYGKRHRATGGNTGYVVGEQGPELFMPDRPGTIVPADDTEAMGAAANVSFTINAIDASGVEDVLSEQQGNIIGMIRQAANSYGEDFLEDLDESTYTTPVARRA